MKTLAAPARLTNKRQVSKWIPGGGGDASISKGQADRFTDGLLKIAERITGLPADFARNHDHYLPRAATKMKPVFADTFFFFAVLNRADPLHHRAVAYSRNTRLLRVTTDWVITESG